jgi:hypothetical protein
LRGFLASVQNEITKRIRSSGRFYEIRYIMAIASIREMENNIRYISYQYHRARTQAWAKMNTTHVNIVWFLSPNNTYS